MSQHNTPANMANRISIVLSEKQTRSVQKIGDSILKTMNDRNQAIVFTDSQKIKVMPCTIGEDTFDTARKANEFRDVMQSSEAVAPHPRQPCEHKEKER